MENNLSPLNMVKEDSYCGMASLSAALCMFDINKTQHELGLLCKDADRKVTGFDEEDIGRAIKRIGLRSKNLLIKNKKDKKFIKHLLNHILKKGPAILCVYDFSHWITVLSYDNKQQKFVIWDSNQSQDFDYWGCSKIFKRCWNENDSDLPDQYFAILISKKTGKYKPANLQYKTFNVFKFISRLFS